MNHNSLGSLTRHPQRCASPSRLFEKIGEFLLFVFGRFGEFWGGNECSKNPPKKASQMS